MDKSKRPNPILLAAAKSQPAIVAAILAHRLAPKIDIDERDASNCSAMGHLAQRGGNADEVSQAIVAMIEAGARLDSMEPDLSAQTSYNRETGAYAAPMVPLASLILRGAAMPWRELMEAMGRKKLKAACASWPLLHEALAHDNIACVELLLDAGADPNQYDPRRGFPIANAQSARGFAKMVASGSKLNLPDPKGRTALQIISASRAVGEVLAMAAAAAQAESKGAVATFKEGQATGKTKANDEIAQPLIEALFAAIDRNNRDRIKALWATLNLARDKQRLFDARDKDGRTLAHAAVGKRNFALLRRLAERGMDLNIFDSSGQSAASLLICLPRDERAERGDRDGERRRKLYQEIAPRIDWAKRSDDGVGYFECLSMRSIETRNGASVADIHAKASAAMPDWLEISRPGEGCMLSRCLAKAIAERGAANNGLLQFMEHSGKPIQDILAEQSKRPEFGKEQAEAILRACYSDKQAAHLTHARGFLSRVSTAIEAALPAFKAAGADPEAIDWCPALASSLPTLHAAVESWRISATAPHDAQSAPRRSKSL